VNPILPKLLQELAEDTGILFRYRLVLLCLVLFSVGCEQPVVVRVYDGPKNETYFVSGPNAVAGTSTVAGSPSRTSPASAGPRRILGAVIPTESGCYFLKATDSPDRLQPLVSDFYNIVAEFTIDPSTGRPSMKLPAGWVMNPRNDIAMAEFVSPAATGGAKFTVTMLAMPQPSEWQDYLLSNINRWRGQLKLPDITPDAINDELVSVTRTSNLLPGYIFDAIGDGAGGMSPVASVSGPSTAASPESNDPKKPQLKYVLPEGWQATPGTPFRLATFAISSSEGDGEVTVSMAVDNPIENTKMWIQQISRESDPEKIQAMAESTIAQAEKIAATFGEGVLYSIRDSEQVDAPMLFVASIPSDRDGLHVFVKLRGNAKVAQAQREKLLQFIQSIQLQ
jgi:hypothetical protein